MSLLEVNDGLAPDGHEVDSFAIAGSSSVVSLIGPHGSQVRAYNPATGTYGSVIASDTSGGLFYVFGVDPFAHTVLIDDTKTGSNGTRTDHVNLYNTQTGVLVGSPDLSGYTIKGGATDAAHNRTDLLAIDKSTRDDAVIPVSMLTGAAGTATDADHGITPKGSLDNIAVDDATGEAYSTPGPGSLLCAGGSTTIAEIDPGTGSVTVTTGGTHCDTDLAVDPTAGNLLSVSYLAESANLAGSSALVVMPKSKPAAYSAHPLRTGGPVELAVDPVHHLALVLYALPDGPPEFGAPGGIAVTDSNAMSVIDVVKIATGRIVKVIGGFSSSSVNGYPFATNAAIQLDPATRTGYMFAPGDDQVQQFSY